MFSNCQQVKYSCRIVPRCIIMQQPLVPHAGSCLLKCFFSLWRSLPLRTLTFTYFLWCKILNVHFLTCKENSIHRRSPSAQLFAYCKGTGEEWTVFCLRSSTWTLQVTTFGKRSVVIHVFRNCSFIIIIICYVNAGKFLFFCKRIGNLELISF